MPSVILATAGYDHTIRLWEVPTGYCYRTLQFAESQINKIEISPNKQYIIAGGNPQIKLFEVGGNNPQAISTYSGHKGNITSLGFHKEGQWFYSAAEDGTVKIWDIRSPNAHSREFTYTEPCTTVALHPNQEEFICGYQNGVIRVYDIGTNECTSEFLPDDDTPVRSITINSLGSHCVIANNRGMCYGYSFRQGDIAQAALDQKWEAHKRYVLKAQFSPDSKLLATTSADHTVKVWHTGINYVERVDDDDELNPRTTVEVQLNNKYELNKLLTGHQRWVWDCVFSSDSAYLITASSDHSSRLWDLQQGETIRTYTGHHKAVMSVALNDAEVNYS
eukprot:TRINITY_DN3940_c0_g1_i1.p1 TRINITY_DN3940_c0_g1~~TRINITY_DN3940_c0_g1_i1.p1  ORF type:complete len:334 (-),score=30.57 TRINITY_DN3940_c0_g1_i1:31-1032(-)